MFVQIFIQNMWVFIIDLNNILWLSSKPLKNKAKVTFNVLILKYVCP